MYPVFSPRRAFIAEDFRLEYGFADDAIGHLDRVRDDFDKLARILGRSQQNAGSEQLANSSSSAVRNRLEHLRRIYDESPFFRHFEQSRATLSSIQYLREKLKPGSVGRDERAEMLELQAESFLTRLRGSYRLLEGKAVTSYIARPTVGESFESISFYSKQPAEPVLDAEIYRASKEATGGWQYRSYSFRWPTSCTERRFFSALNGIVRLTERGRSRHRSIKLRRMVSGDDIRSGGIVVFTRSAIYGTSYEEIPEHVSLNEISLEHLQQAVVKVGGENSESAIESVRVCTEFGDFQLDVSGNDIGAREVFVISQYNISRQIIYLCERTSLASILPGKLHKIVQEYVTSRFPEFKVDTRGQAIE